MTTKTMTRHLWYLSEELVGLSLFDDDVKPNMKDEIAQAIMHNEKEAPAKKVTLALESVGDKTLATFASSNTRSLFAKLKIPDSFLQIPAAQWEGNEDYRTARTLCRLLSVTNDHAERGVALVQDFSGRLTKDEDQLQYLLQVVFQHRKDFPQPLKSTLTGK